MFTLKFDLTEAALDALKAELLHALPNVKSSHRCEAIARGLGFGTYAAARGAAKSSDRRCATADGKAFVSYLAEHGFEVSSLPLFRAAARIALKAVAERTPKLTMWGFGIGRPRRKADGRYETSAEMNTRFSEARAELISDSAVGPFLLSLALLERVTATKTIRAGTGSYWLKHIAENYACTYPGGEELGPQYVPNGAFIAAAIHAGFRSKSYVDDYGYDEVNVSFNMSKPLLVDLDCEIRPNGARAEDRRRKQEEREMKRLQRQFYNDYRPLFGYLRAIGEK